MKQRSAREAAIISLQRNFRMVAAQRERLELKRAHDDYWGYAFGLMREEAALTLQRSLRAYVTRVQIRRVQTTMDEWETLMKRVRASCERREAAALKLQRGVRHWKATQIRGSRVARRFLFFQQATKSFDEGEEINPFSETYVGQTEHRRRVEADIGKPLGAFGKPKRSAMERAFPSQLATMLNVLRFVDAVNAILLREYVDVLICRVPETSLGVGATLSAAPGKSRWKETGAKASAGSSSARGIGSSRGSSRGGAGGGGSGSARSSSGNGGNGASASSSLSSSSPCSCSSSTPRSSRMSRSVSYDDLMSWGDAALQTRFSGVAQYLKSSKRLGLLTFEGELARSGRVTSLSLGLSRGDLLRVALQNPLFWVPAMRDDPKPAEKLASKLESAPHKGQVDDFLRGCFDGDHIYSVVDASDTEQEDDDKENGQQRQEQGAEDKLLSA